MDKVSNIVHFNNPNVGNKHPHQIQSSAISHTLKGQSKNDEHPTLVKLKDWKPGDIEMFASMGFSHQNAGEEGYYMEEDILPIGMDEPQKYVRRISRTKNHQWVLEKKHNQTPDSQFSFERKFSGLIGNEKSQGMLDYFDTLTDDLTERIYLYKTMKLKTILENLPPAAPQSPLRQDIVPVSQHAQAEGSVVQRGLSKEQKKMLQSLVSEYNKYNEVLEARKNLMEVANKMSNIGELSEAYLTEKLHEGNSDENAWFEEKTIRRNTAEIKKMASEFKKLAAECDETMKGMQTLYKECGMMLERYFHMD
jgi:hypothetical protein